MNRAHIRTFWSLLQGAANWALVSRGCLSGVAWALGKLTHKTPTRSLNSEINNVSIEVEENIKTSRSIHVHILYIYIHIFLCIYIYIFIYLFK